MDQVKDAEIHLIQTERSWQKKMSQHNHVFCNDVIYRLQGHVCEEPLLRKWNEANHCITSSV